VTNQSRHVNQESFTRIGGTGLLSAPESYHSPIGGSGSNAPHAEPHLRHAANPREPPGTARKAQRETLSVDAQPGPCFDDLTMRRSLHALALLAVTGPVLSQTGSITFSNSNPAGGGVEVPHAAQLVPQSGITVEAWVTYDETTLGTSTTNRWPTIMRTGFQSQPNAFNLRVDAGQTADRILKWTVNADSRVQVRWNFQPGQLLTWTHVAATYDGAAARLFINGQEVASANTTGPLRDVGDAIRIGQGTNHIAPENETWNGSLDEVRLWPFARTAGEIQATMNMALGSVPGLVSTWNFDQNTDDTSSGMNGTLMGAAAYSTNTPPALAPYTFPGIAFGTSTPGCLGAIHATTTALPQVGNLDFAFAVHALPPNALAVMLLGSGPGTGPLRVVGVDLWLDPNGVISGVPAATDALGTARLPFPLASTLPANLGLSVQLFAVDPCGPLGLTASEALAIATF
jgi:hypothetical protein